MTFADDRLKKFQYELEHPSPNKHTEMLNFLMNSYIGCVDDAADLIQLGLEKQDNIRQAIDLMAAKTKEFLPILRKYAAEGPELEISTMPSKARRMPSTKPRRPRKRPRRHP